MKGLDFLRTTAAVAAFAVLLAGCSDVEELNDPMERPSSEADSDSGKAWRFMEFGRAREGGG